MLSGNVLRVLFVGALLLLGSAQAFADPFIIRSGSILYSRSNQADFSLTFDPLVFGTASWAQGVFGNQESESWTPDHACFGCPPGTTMDVSLTEHLVNSDSRIIGVSGIMRQDTTDWSVNALQFTIDAEPFTIPALTPGEGEATLGPLLRFTFRGNIAGHSDGNALGMSLIGQGTARVLFESENWFDTTFRFEDPAAIPEPASLLLVGTGIAGLVVRRRRGSVQL